MNLPIYEEPRFNEFKNIFEVIENGKMLQKLKLGYNVKLELEKQ